MSAPVPQATTIHDLGYQRYDGPRDGAQGARRALFWQGFRGMFGVGRPARAKLMPAFLITASLLPCLGALAASSATQGQMPITYAGFIGPALLLHVLFAAAQAPEVLSRDQQHRVLPLMLTRDVTRLQYAAARLVAVWCAMLVVTGAPLLLLTVGQIGIAADPAAAAVALAPKVGPVLLQGTLTAWVIGGIASALASLTARRAYASASIIGVFLTAAAVSAGLDDLTGISSVVADLIDPIRSLNTMLRILFDEPTRAMELTPPPSVWVFVAMALALGALGVAATCWRMRRVRV